jgi:hypothetical protein
VKLSNSTGDTLDANTVNVVSAGTGYDTTIVVESGTGNTIFNNVVNSESCPAEALVHFSGEQNTRFVFNTLRLSSWRMPMSYCFEAWCERPCDVRNNVFVLARPAESTNACVGIRPIGDSVVPDYNCYFVESLGHACASPDPFYPNLYTWDEWRGFGFEANGINADPILASAIDLHLRQGSPCIGTATPIAGIDFDIDGDPRDPAHPDIGADEFTGGAVGETQSAEVRATHASTVIHGMLLLPERQNSSTITGCLLDINGREVMELRSGANDVRALAPGVYFVREAQAQAQVVRKVVVTR